MESNTVRQWYVWVTNPKNGQSMKAYVMADNQHNAKAMFESQYRDMWIAGSPQLNS